jgi:hypothetical protein
MANHEQNRASMEEAIRVSDANITQMESDLALLEAFEQDRRAALLRQDIAKAYDRHRALVRCFEAGCTCEDCMCGDTCPCGKADQKEEETE